jgi:hypothetical protein
MTERVLRFIPLPDFPRLRVLTLFHHPLRVSPSPRPRVAQDAAFGGSSDDR